MTLDLQVIPLTAFVAVMATAAFEDFRRLVIPNLLPIALCALWPLYFCFAAKPSVYGALVAIGCAVAVFLAAAAVFFLNSSFLGGGDVKLLGAAALWAGPSGIPALLVLTSLLGGGLALIMLLGGARIAAAARARLGQPPIDVGRGRKMEIPYGLAIIGAALIVTLAPHFG